MKFILLAATAMLAVPAIAQTTSPAPAGQEPAPMAAQSPTAADPAQTADPATTPQPNAPMTDAPAPASTDTMQTPAAPAQATGGGTPMGGYQPTQPPLNGAATPGVAPVFQPAPSPSQAYPAPAPLAKYPVCKKGQYDKCIQRGGK